jgi:hypothetical protein
MPPWLVLVTAIGMMLLAVAAGVLIDVFVTSVFGESSPVTELVPRVAFPVVVVLMVYLWWRWSGRPRGRGAFARSGLRPLRAAPHQFALGTALAALVVGALAGLEGLLGIGRVVVPGLETKGAGGAILWVLSTLLSAWAVQGFPEELIFRGQAPGS